MLFVCAKCILCILCKYTYIYISISMYTIITCMSFHQPLAINHIVSIARKIRKDPWNTIESKNSYSTIIMNQSM